MHLVFVYGTLRQGYSNNPWLQDATFLGNATTKEKYTLRVGSIPYVNKNKQTHIIVGEVYLVTEDNLKRLDRLENHPRWYYREQISVVLENGAELVAWIYFNEDTTCKIVESGDFAQHKQKYFVN